MTNKQKKDLTAGEYIELNISDEEHNSFDGPGKKHTDQSSKGSKPKFSVNLKKSAQKGDTQSVRSSQRGNRLLVHPDFNEPLNLHNRSD